MGNLKRGGKGKRRGGDSAPERGTGVLLAPGGEHAYALGQENENGWTRGKKGALKKKLYTARGNS